MCDFAGNQGDVILFDYRVVHRGMANEGTQSRPVLYATHTRPWFSDVNNFPAERLLPDKPGSRGGPIGFNSKASAKATKPKAKKRR